MREFSGKGCKSSGVNKLLIRWMSKRKHGSGIHGLCMGLINDGHGQLKASVQVNGGRFEH